MARAPKRFELGAALGRAALAVELLKSKATRARLGVKTKAADRAVKALNLHIGKVKEALSKFPFCQIPEFGGMLPPEKRPPVKRRKP